MPELPPPTLRREGDDLIFTWEQAGAQVLVRDLAIGRDGPRAEVWARHFPDVHLHVGMLNLLSTTSKANFIRAVSDRDGATDWADAIEQVGVLATEFHRAGEPLELLEPRRRPEAGQYAIEPLAPLGQPTLWYGDGKSLKSYALLAGCRAMSRGESLAGMQTTHLKPAILDFEWDKTEHDDRLLRLGGDADIYYRHCTGSLHEQVRSLRREFDRVNVDFLGIDGLGLACGGDPSNPEIALRFFSALRALERTAVVIHHTPNEAKNPSAALTFGTPLAPAGSSRDPPA